MEQNKNDFLNGGMDSETEIDLLEVLQIIWKHLLLILETGLCVGAVVFLICTIAVPKEYVSTTKVYILQHQSNSDSLTYTDLQTGSYLTDDYKELITSLPVVEKVIARLNLEMTQDIFIKKIRVTSPDDTRIIQISVTDEDPYQARLIADAVREAASEQISRVMDIEAVRVVQEANYPEKKAGPARMKYTMLGCVLGCMFAAAVLILMHIFDDTIKTADDVESSLGLFVLGSIPMTKAVSDHKKNRKRFKGGNYGQN